MGTKPQRETDEAVRFAWYDEVEGVRQAGEVRPAVYAAYLHLLRKAGGRPGTLSITARMLAGWFGKDARTAREWIGELEEHGLIEVDHRERGGRFSIYVLAPDSPRRRAAQHDPQRPLPGLDEADSDEPEAPAAVQFSPGKIAQFSPGKIAQESPPSEEQTPQNKGFAAEGAGRIAQESPRPLHGIHREGKSNPPSVHGTIRFMDHGGARWKDARPDGQSREPAHVTGALVEALNNFDQATHPTRQKDRLVKMILDALRDPHTDRSIPNRAADLVVNGDIPPQALQQVLSDIEGIREAHEAGTGAGFTSSPGAFFLSWCKRQPGWKEPKLPRKPR